MALFFCFTNLLLGCGFFLVTLVAILQQKFDEIINQNEKIVCFLGELGSGIVAIWTELP